MSSAAAREHSDPVSLKAAARVAELFERHGRMVFGISRAMLRDVHDAEDATQQVFLSAHRALLGGATVRDSGAWIATIARNECRGRISAGMRNPLPVAHDDLPDLPTGADQVEQRLRARELFEALATLPERQRHAIVLRYVYGLRYGEVSTALGISRPATEALLFRARRAMRVHLRPIAGAVLVVPLAVREELASALPGFESQASAGAGVGLAGGLLAKLASTPMVAKIGTVALAASAVGAVGAVQSEGTARATRDRAPSVREVEAVATGSSATNLVSPGGLAVERVNVVRRSRVHGGEGTRPADSSGGQGNGERSLAADPVSSSGGNDDDSDAREAPTGSDSGSPSETGHESSGSGRDEENRESTSSGSSVESSDDSLDESSGTSGSGSDDGSAGSGSSGSDSLGSSEASGSDHDSSGSGSGGGSDGEDT